MYPCGFLGTEMPYSPFPYNITWPEGYQPVYISHLGRHGSRYMTSGKDLDTLIQWLTEATVKKQITYFGKCLLNDLLSLSLLSQKKWGQLTPLGDKEQFYLAVRMYKRFPQIFNKKVFADSTYIKRAVQSMKCFTAGLYSCDNTITVEQQINKKADPILRFFDLNLQYLSYKKKGAWKSEQENFVNRCNIGRLFLSQFVSDISSLPLPCTTLASMIYNANCNCYNVFEASAMQHFFSRREMRYFWQNENCKNYLEKGPSGIGTNLPQDIAFGLLQNIITQTETALGTSTIGANFRFAHAETIIPFAALIGINHYGLQTDNLFAIPYFWRDSTVAPMATNIQFVFFQGLNKPTLVRVLYNEKDAFLPLPPQYPCFYKWTDVKAYFEQILSALPIPTQYDTIVQQVKYFKL
ncbi:MAG: histidine-type phosphatase [Oscillospiraceae bacterium]|nr:histidine-type phosphatase [Oscillospiraceae bacterium]